MSEMLSSAVMDNGNFAAFLCGMMSGVFLTMLVCVMIGLKRDRDAQGED